MAWTRKALAWAGLFSLLFFLSAITQAYGFAAKWLSSAEYSSKCEYIVLLPAGPVPNAATLARAYKTAEEYSKNPSAKVIISHLQDGAYVGSTLWTIKRELILRGIPAGAIILEKKARSTNEHAKYIKEQGIGNPAKDSYLLVTSPTHVKRSVMAFKAEGFANVYASAAVSAGGEEDLGAGLFFRYDIWSRLSDQVWVARELTAIIFYKLKGWA